jgi:hypothetical protein
MFIDDGVDDIFYPKSENLCSRENVLIVLISRRLVSNVYSLLKIYSLAALILVLSNIIEIMLYIISNMEGQIGWLELILNSNLN